MTQTKKIGELIIESQLRNEVNSPLDLWGVSIDKKFIKSVANIIGTDLSKYKVVKKNQFVCSLMQVSRDEKIPIGLWGMAADIIVSPAYKVFGVRDSLVILPEYMNLWFKRTEFDREASYYGVGGVRGSLEWEDFCEMEMPVPSIDIQKAIVSQYNDIEKRISIKRQINDNLAASLSAVFSEMFSCLSTTGHLKLSELMTFGNGKSRPKANGSVPVYGGNGVLSYTDQYNIENAVLIGRVGAYCGSVYLEQGICWVSDNAIYAKSKVSKEEFFDYFLLKKLNLFDYHVGTGQQLLTQEILNNIDVIKPDFVQIENFNLKAKSTFATIFANKSEILRLQKLSNLLLSRLSN